MEHFALGTAPRAYISAGLRKRGVNISVDLSCLFNFKIIKTSCTNLNSMVLKKNKKNN